MKRSEYITRQLERYGSAVTVTPKNGTPIKVNAIIQPLRLKKTMDSEAMGIVGGNREQSGMLYLGPVGCRLDQFARGTTITTENGAVYWVISVRCVMVAGAPIYVWAVLQETAKEDVAWKIA